MPEQHISWLSLTRPLRRGGLSRRPHYTDASESMQLKFFEPVPQFLRLLIYIRLLISHQHLVTKQTV